MYEEPLDNFLDGGRLRMLRGPEVRRYSQRQDPGRRVEGFRVDAPA